MTGRLEFYDRAYGELEYGGTDESFAQRTREQLDILAKAFDDAGITGESRVLEVGCGIGYLRNCHPNWQGVEYSSVAVAQAKERYGPRVPIAQGDATHLEFPDKSFDFAFSFATLEHIPAIERALQEIARVTKRAMLLWPAWNCRPWTVKKLEIRPYGELGLFDKAEKALIPLRNSLPWRATLALPSRLKREALIAAGMRNLPLDYRRLTPDFSLNDRFPHISDDDASVSIDAHAVLAYFVSRDWVALSHRSTLRRLTCRAEPVLLKRLR